VEYAIVLDEETLLFFAEVLVTQRLLCKVAEATANGPREGIMAVWLQGVNESAFKELFQEPLKHRAFRKIAGSFWQSSEFPSAVYGGCYTRIDAHVGYIEKSVASLALAVLVHDQNGVLVSSVFLYNLSYGRKD
jgi:hypothetical protein